MTAFTQYMILSKNGKEKMQREDPEGFTVLEASFKRELNEWIDRYRDELQLKRLQRERRG